MKNCIYCDTEIIEIYEKEGQVLCPNCGRYKPPDAPRGDKDSRIYVKNDELSKIAINLFLITISLWILIMMLT